MKKLAAALILAILCLASLPACTAGKSGGDASPSQDQPICIGVTSIVRAMDPTASGVPWSLTSHGICEKLYTQNEKGGWSPASWNIWSRRTPWSGR